jgi:hypothetical protein
MPILHYIVLETLLRYYHNKFMELKAKVVQISLLANRFYRRCSRSELIMKISLLWLLRNKYQSV